MELHTHARATRHYCVFIAVRAGASRTAHCALPAPGLFLSRVPITDALTAALSPSRRCSHLGWREAVAGSTGAAAGRAVLAGAARCWSPPLSFQNRRASPPTPTLLLLPATHPPNAHRSRSLQHPVLARRSFPIALHAFADSPSRPPAV